MSSGSTTGDCRSHALNAVQLVHAGIQRAEFAAMVARRSMLVHAMTGSRYGANPYSCCCCKHRANGDVAQLGLTSGDVCQAQGVVIIWASTGRPWPLARCRSWSRCSCCLLRLHAMVRWQLAVLLHGGHLLLGLLPGARSGLWGMPGSLWAWLRIHSPLGWHGSGSW
jgi:hypothetical protein